MTAAAPAPGSAEWLRYMTASKIAAVVGTSPCESRFSLWHRMHGDLPPQEQTDEMTYGHYLEPVLLKWFADQHPELSVHPGQWFERDGWAGATPDGMVYGRTKRDMAVVQCKTARNAWEWDNGAPAGYIDQVLWEMYVSGARKAWLVADVAMQFREYPVTWDAARVAELVAAAQEFMDSLAAGHAPKIDGSTHTYLAVRNLHPDIDDDKVTIPGDLAVRFLDAHCEATRWAAAEQQAKSEIAALMGNARRGVWNDRTLFTRQARGNGIPYLVAARNLPTTQEPAA